MLPEARVGRKAERDEGALMRELAAAFEDARGALTGA